MLSKISLIFFLKDKYRRIPVPWDNLEWANSERLEVDLRLPIAEWGKVGSKWLLVQEEMRECGARRRQGEGCRQKARRLCAPGPCAPRPGAGGFMWMGSGSSPGPGVPAAEKTRPGQLSSPDAPRPASSAFSPPSVNKELKGTPHRLRSPRRSPRTGSSRRQRSGRCQGSGAARPAPASSLLRCVYPRAWGPRWFFVFILHLLPLLFKYWGFPPPPFLFFHHPSFIFNFF